MKRCDRGSRLPDADFPEQLGIKICNTFVPSPKAPPGLDRLLYNSAPVRSQDVLSSISKEAGGRYERLEAS